MDIDSTERWGIPLIYRKAATRLLTGVQTGDLAMQVRWGRHGATTLDWRDVGQDEAEDVVAREHGFADFATLLEQRRLADDGSARPWSIVDIVDWRRVRGFTAPGCAVFDDAMLELIRAHGCSPDQAFRRVIAHAVGLGDQVASVIQFQLYGDGGTISLDAPVGLPVGYGHLLGGPPVQMGQALLAHGILVDRHADRELVINAWEEISRRRGIDLRAAAWELRLRCLEHSHAGMSEELRQHLLEYLIPVHDSLASAPVLVPWSVADPLRPEEPWRARVMALLGETGAGQALRIRGILGAMHRTLPCLVISFPGADADAARLHELPAVPITPADVLDLWSDPLPGIRRLDLDRDDDLPPPPDAPDQDVLIVINGLPPAAVRSLNGWLAHLSSCGRVAVIFSLVQQEAWSDDHQVRSLISRAQVAILHRHAWTTSIRFEKTGDWWQPPSLDTTMIERGQALLLDRGRVWELHEHPTAMPVSPR